MSLCISQSLYLVFYICDSLSLPPSLHLPSPAPFLSLSLSLPLPLSPSPSLPPFSPNPLSLPPPIPHSICPTQAPPLACPCGPRGCKEGPAASWTGSFSSCGITKPSPAQPRLLDLRLTGPCPAENGRPINTEASARTGEEMPHLTQPFGEDLGVSTSQNPSLETF